MPVDLSTIPAPARRSTPPLFKRWLFFLTMAVIICGVATLYLWPADQPAQTPVFWYYFLIVPSLLWLSLFALRWLIHTFSDCVDDGWDEEREWTLYKETQRGQRYVNVLGQVTHLPHAITSISLSMQLIFNDIILTSTVDETSLEVIRQARFDDISLPVSDRLRNRIIALLGDSTLTMALSQLSLSQHLSVSLQTDTGGKFYDSDLPLLWEGVLQTIALPAIASLAPSGGLDTLDAWLDKSAAGQALLVISVRLADEQKDGDGDAAVAILLQTPALEENSHGTVARIHRPERAKTAEQLTSAVSQSLLWGKIAPGSIGQIWLTGMGCDNQAQSLFSSVDMAFSSVVTPAQLCDIDIHTGLTGKVSPWLALAIAVDNAVLNQYSQLIMSVPETNALLPWFIVVHPAAFRTTAS